MHRLCLVVLLYLGTAVQECVFARDDGRFASDAVDGCAGRLAKGRR